jgi:Na+/H+ antiporter NhaC
MGAIFILLAVGALIGTWNMAGTIPTVVSYGIALLRPGIFYLALALICAVVGMVTGSSWTTAGTLGVAFVGMAPILGMSTAIAAGAVVSGAYVGDKMTPLSETTILVPGLVARRGLAPRMLSRTVEDTGTVTSPLVPWNSCGAYMTGVLGVSTMQYLPYAFFNMLNPLVALAYAFTGFRIEHLGPTEAGGPNVVGGVESSAELPLLAPGGESHVE